jgi:hypothetical protein
MTPIPDKAEEVPSVEGLMVLVSEYAEILRGYSSGHLSAAWSAIEDYATRLSAPRIPPGYALVPVEPTDDMKRAGLNVLLHEGDIYAREDGTIVIETITPRDLWRDMLNAAPPAPRMEAVKGGWRDIETAPEGTMILCANMKAREARDWAYVAWMAGGRVCGHRMDKPTHWMPLPAPPLASLPGEGGEADPLNGIAANGFHGEGAIAQCGYCRRYSLDPKTLGADRYQPVCECGEKHGWSGSFKRPGPDARWSGKRPASAGGEVDKTQEKA